MIAFMLAASAARESRCSTPTGWPCRPRTDLVRASVAGTTARARASRVQRIGAPRREPCTERLGRRLAERMRRRSRDLTGLNQDLAITGATLEAHT